MVKEKENAIRSMTTEQMRRELLLAGKERLLDSLRYSSALDSMKLAQSELQLRQQAAELSARESELALRNSQRKFFVALAALGLLLAGGLFYRYRVTREHNLLLAQKNEIIEEERRRSENLLLNILPFTVAEELKRQGFAAARRYEEATVLFADFVGFSRLSKQMPPEELVSTLDHAFKHCLRHKFFAFALKKQGKVYFYREMPASAPRGLLRQPHSYEILGQFKLKRAPLFAIPLNVLILQRKI
jgi:hypothetical protein